MRLRTGPLLILFGGTFLVVAWAKETVRLTGGHSDNEGRVEVMYQEVWRAVCGDLLWDNHDAAVVCGQLGYEEALASSCCSEEEEKWTPGVWMDAFNCTGNESSVLECDHSGRGNVSCQGFSAASVICSPSVRLVGGSTAREGRVEVYHSGTWGTVCGQHWDIRDATVVCHVLGYATAMAALGNVTYSKGNTSVWLNEVNCIGNETSLSTCVYDGWENNTCNQSQGAGVTCVGQDVRLVGGKSDSEGRVEVLYRGVWGTVCNDSWDMLDAQVTCRQLGFDAAVAASLQSPHGIGCGVIWLHSVQCNGSESSLLECNHSSWGSTSASCSHHDDAGVICRSQVLFSAKLQFVSSELDTITMTWHVTTTRLEMYTLQIWSNDTEEWQSTKCKESNVTEWCVLKKLNATVTITGLSPDTVYYYRLVTPFLAVGSVSEAMRTKKLVLFSAKLQFVSSELDTITMTWHVTTTRLETYTLQIWSNDSEEWQSTKCKESNVTELCVLRKLNATVTITDLSPDTVYYYRLVTPSLAASSVSEAMRTKKLEAPSNLRLVSSSKSSITISWTPGTSVTVNYTVEMRSHADNTWTIALCTENLIGDGCVLSNTTATVIGLAPDKMYYFRVYAVYGSWRSPPSLSSDVMRTQKTGELWIGSLTPECVTSQIGHVITLLCHVNGNDQVSYKWTKGERVLSNNSALGVLNVTTSSQNDFGVYTCHVSNSESVTRYNISVCQKIVQEKTVVAANTDDVSSTARVIITTCFISFAIFMVVLILLKIAQIYFRKRKQSAEISRGREELPMLRYRNKSRSGTKNEEDVELNP